MKDSGESLLTVFEHEVLMYQVECKECVTYVSCFHRGTLKDNATIIMNVNPPCRLSHYDFSPRLILPRDLTPNA